MDVLIGQRDSDYQPPVSEESAIPNSSRIKDKSRACVVTEDDCEPEVASRGSKCKSSKRGGRGKASASVLNEDESNQSHGPSSENMQKYQPGDQNAREGKLMLCKSHVIDQVTK